MSNCNSYRAPPWSGFRTEFDKQLQAKYSTCDSVIPCSRTGQIIPVIPTTPLMPMPMPRSPMPTPMPMPRSPMPTPMPMPRSPMPMPTPMPMPRSPMPMPMPTPMPMPRSPMPRSPMPRSPMPRSPMGTKLGAPEMHTCADGTIFECAGGTQGCMDNSPLFC